MQNPHFLLTAKSGYLALGETNHSNYDGYFVKINGSMAKVVAAIAPVVSLQKDLIINDHSVIRKNDSGDQEIALFDEGIRVRSSVDCTITLDCKKVYDESDQGRVYRQSFSHNGSFSIIEVSYTKYADGALLRGQDKKIYLIIGQKKQHIKTLAQLRPYSGWPISDVPNLDLIQFPDVLASATFKDGTLVRGRGGKIYRIEDGKKKHIKSLAQLRPYAGQKIFDVADDILTQYPDA